jgi:hypothetical protein
LSHYDTLEVSPKASAEVIRAAYKSLMQRNHPDKNADAAQATARAAIIAQAYDVLSDPQRRLAYDETLLRDLPVQVPAAEFAPGNAASRAGLRRNIPAAPGWQTWYATVLILCIIGAGSAIMVLSKNKAARDPVAQHPGAAMASAPEKEVSANLPTPGALTPGSTATSGGETPEPQDRTISAFATDLSVELISPDPARPDVIHVLHIPSLGLVLVPGEAERLRPRIESQRSAILRQLLMTLSRAQYHELIKADGDLYLKRLVEDAVCEGIGLQGYGAWSNPTQTPPSRKWPLDALLPQAYSIR